MRSAVSRSGEHTAACSVSLASDDRRLPLGVQNLPGSHDSMARILCAPEHDRDEHSDDEERKRAGQVVEVHLRCVAGGKASAKVDQVGFELSMVAVKHAF